MGEYVDLTIRVLTLATLVVGGILAVRRFGLKRELLSFVRMDVSGRTIHEATDVVLVLITVHLENKGETRINARIARQDDGYLYNIGPDTCRHAGTLKIRAVPNETVPLLFDWYSLSPLQMRTRLIPKESMVVSETDLEQINYLDEFQDPETDYEEVHFWLEPGDSYDFSVLVWLRPGIYAAKAYFLGPIIKHAEEEYWSCHTVFKAGAQSNLSPPALESA